jgi:hypothetical protein
MEKLYLWPSMPFLSLLVLVLGSMAFLFFAREPMQHAFKTLAQALSGGLRLIANLSKEAAGKVKERGRELVVESGLAAQENRVEHELRRLEESYAKGLADYPSLHLKLDGCITAIDSDYKEATDVPPEVPGWSKADGVVNVEGVADRTVKKMLEDMHKAALDSEKKILHEYRSATAKRHKILSAMAPRWNEVKGTLERVKKLVSELIAATRRIDGYMDRYEKIRAAEDPTVRALAFSSVKLFVVSLLVIVIAAGAAFINFQLIALPMSELVPGGSRLMGLPVATIAALVIVLMEVVAGIFVLDTLGITALFPQLRAIASSQRRIIFSVALGGLFLLASIEASLAVLREQLVEAEMTLMESLAATGGNQAVAAVTDSIIPVVGQAVLGFTLPWIIAMIAIPLEMLVESGRHVLGKALVALLMVSSFVANVLAFLALYLILILSFLYDAFIMVPVQIERWIRGDKAPKRAPLTIEELTQGAAASALTDHLSPAVSEPNPAGAASLQQPLKKPAKKTPAKAVETAE